MEAAKPALRCAHIRYAIGASLVSVIATSSGAAAAYAREGYTNIRVGFEESLPICVRLKGF